MNVIIKNKATRHQQKITKDAWEKGEKYFVGYHLVGDEPELLTGEPEKKVNTEPKKIIEPEKPIESLFESDEPKPKRKRKKKPENNPE